MWRCECYGTASDGDDGNVDKSVTSDPRGRLWACCLKSLAESAGEING